jgi:hypothetical protein
MSKINVGDLVKRATNKPAQYRPGKRGGVVGSAAAHLSPERLYRVQEVAPNGGLRLQHFALAVSPADVCLVEAGGPLCPTQTSWTLHFARFCTCTCTLKK